MKRYINILLENWASSGQRKPLLLLGARQVGKTFALTELGQKKFKSFLYLNFEKNTHAASLFDESLEPEQIVRRLEIHFKVKIVPSSTLIFFDEVQKCERALNSLKYFCEDAPHYFVCAAGSLLGVKGPKIHSFPVGKVQTLIMHPMTFSEYLDAQSEKKLLDEMANHDITKPLVEAFHRRLVEILKEYFVAGGMPEVVKTFLETRDFQKVRDIQNELIRNYEFDFAKHATPADAPKISAIWNSLPSQLARENKKFKFSEVAKNARAREYQDALTWLVDAKVVLKSERVTAPRLPLKGYVELGVFKLFALDVGLLGAMADLDPSVLLEGHHLFSEFNGAFVENFIAQETVAELKNSKLFYWASDGKAEVDFLLQIKNQIVPLEAKAGLNVRSQSLGVYIERYEPPIALRASLQNFKVQAKLLNIPLYAISRVRDIELQQV